MDRIESLAGQLSQITMYDIKSYYNQAKNVVLNVSEMEAKVREATNDEPWGASSTLMQDIATGTFNFQNFNEIMPCIYARFMEKEARQWREIYKALQLLEYLIKHGSERVVDDARSHISTIKMLRNFHYIDDKGKDEGVNVRNRSKELAEMLSDVEKIRSERRKAKANRHKYTGTGNDGGMSFNSGGSRYGGFGNEGGFSGGSYSGDAGSSASGGGGSSNYDRDYGGGGGGYSGSSGGFRDEGRKAGGFEEYDAGDDDSAVSRRSTSTAQRATSTSSPRRGASVASAPPPAPKLKEPEVDLLGGFGDEDTSAAVNVFATNKALPVVTPPAVDDDDFGDFSAAPVSPTSPPAQQMNLMDMLKSSQTSAPTHASRPSMGMASPSAAPTNTLFNMLSPSSTTSAKPTYASPTYFNTNQTQSQPQSSGIQNQNKPAYYGGSFAPMSAGPTSPPIRTGSTPAASTASKPTSNFDDLWSMSLGSSSFAAKPAVNSKSIKDLEKEKAQAGIWGAGQKTGGAASGMNQFGGGFGGSSSSGGGGDDLLL